MRALLILLALTVAAAAEDRGAWFKSLMQPNGGGSCCDISDCRPTASDWRDGQWWAVVNGRWSPVPPAVVLQHRTSILDDAVICNGAAGTIYCFVPKLMGL